MGGGGSSSKRKSFKKRRSKLSTEAQQRKRSMRSKSKKLRHRDDSVSSYLNDDSTSSVSVSSYSSQDDYRSKRTRSCRQIDSRNRRKRAQRSSSSGESSESSSLVRKRKRSRRIRDSDVRKKTSRKKLRRDASISSTSSDSWSCSTCHHGSSTSSSKESEPERPRGRSIEEKKDGRDLGKARSGTKRTRYTSRSCSSCSKYSGDCGNFCGEKLAEKNNSSRLRSIVTVAKPAGNKEEKLLDKDEEIVYDHDDYPSCRSNDTNDGGSKRETAQHVHLASEKRGVESTMGESVVVPNVRITPVESVKGGDGQHNGINPASDGSASDYAEKENHSQIFTTIAASDGDELESILRQKALENLRRFRGEQVTNNKMTPPDQKDKSDSDVKQRLAEKTESIQSKSQSDVNQLSTTKAVCVQSKLSKQDESNVVAQLNATEKKKRPLLRRDFFEKSVQDGKFSGTASVTAKGSATCSSYGTVVSGNPKGNHSGAINPTTNKSDLGNSAIRKESSPAYSTLKQAATSQETSKVDLLVTGSTGSKNAAEKSQMGGQNGTSVHSIGVTKDCGSAVPEPSSYESTSLGNSSKESQNEAKDGSQYQQKTMSVMRGGEMVQVSYKVYIPKNAPALARRKLQR